MKTELNPNHLTIAIPPISLALLVISLFMLNLFSNPATSTSLSNNPILEPPLPGMMPGTVRPRLIIAQDINFPPYAYLAVPPESNYTLAGFAHDIAHGCASLCNWDLNVVQTNWNNCIEGDMVGQGLMNGWFHSCTSYTHTFGQRKRFLEFSESILQDNKPAGLIVKLVNGKPTVNPHSDLSGLRVVDVSGWAPTADGLMYVTNTCTGKHYTNYTMIIPNNQGRNANDVAMQMLRDDKADALWIYADQAHNYDCSTLQGKNVEWDCSLWNGLGTDYAYIATGMLGHAVNGTTLTTSRKGSGMNDIINPCLRKFMKTQEYYTLCKKHGLESTCYPNSHFPQQVVENNKQENIFYKTTTKNLQSLSTCADGYCSCNG